MIGTGSECKRIREESSISQTLLAAKSGVSQPKISRFEDANTGITRDEKERIFGALAVIPEMPYAEIVAIRKTIDPLGDDDA